MPNILLEDIFDLKEINPDGEFFDNVSRIFAISENFDMEMYLDINTLIYPLTGCSKFFVVLADGLVDGSVQDPDEFVRSKQNSSLADKFEYVMFGRIFKCDEEEKDKLTVYVSFGGLLMKLKGDIRNLEGIELDNRLYLLMRKIGMSEFK